MATSCSTTIGPLTDKNFGAACYIVERCGANVDEEFRAKITDGSLGILTQFHPVCSFSRLAFASEVPVAALLTVLNKAKSPAAASHKKSKATPENNILVIKEVAVLPAFQRKGIGMRLIENLFMEVTLLNLSVATTGADLPTALTTTKAQELCCSGDVMWFELKRNLKLQKRLPINSITVTYDDEKVPFWDAVLKSQKIPKEFEHHVVEKSVDDCRSHECTWIFRLKP